MFTKIKIALSVCGSLLVGGAGIAAAQSASPDTHADHQAKREEMKEKMLAKYDINKDGKLDKAERAAMKNERAEEAFKKADSNGDGKLSIEEFKTLRQHQGRHGGFRHHHKGMGQQGRGEGTEGPTE
ncbi:hypothetical protein BH11MYX1_BH11MYX1_41510 [soil metagenome]